MTDTTDILSRLPAHRQQLYRDFYKLGFDPDGCPVKRSDSGTAVFHPILAAYLIFDFASAYEYDLNGPCLGHAAQIAESALQRAELFQDTLVFFYDESDGLSYVPGRFFSALTQAWFVIALCKLNRFRPKYREPILRIFNSLLVPIETGGVLVRKPFGWIVEEYPHDPRFYTLNGWLTVLRWIIRCVDDLEALGLDAHGFLRQNIRAAAHLLPLYDAGFCLNSRYQLTGFSRIQVIFDKPVDVEVESFSVEIPGEGVYPGALTRQDSRWKNYLERAEGRLRQFSVTLSLIAFPEPNRFRLSLRTGTPCSVRIRLAKGDYRPSNTGMPTERWDDIAKVDLPAPGAHQIACDIPYDEQNLFAYPTNFKKLIDGKYYNSYHFIHIWGCAEIFQYSGEPVFKDYCLRFLDYFAQWESLGLSESYSIQPYFPERGDFATFIRGLLDGARV